LSECAQERILGADEPPRLRSRREGLWWFIGKRVMLLPISALAIVTATFFILAALPGDIALEILGPVATPQQLAATNARLGLNEPVPVRYWHYMSGLLHGNLGVSYYTDTPVTTEIREYLPSTVELIIPSFILAISFGLALGTIGSYFRSRYPDSIVRSVLNTLQSVPDFLLGLILIFVFFSKLNWLPGPEGQLGFATSPPPHHTGIILIDALIAGDSQVAYSAFIHLILPVATLALVYSVAFGRATRGLLGAALDSEYTRYGRACGLGELRLVRNALLTCRTGLGTAAALTLAVLIGGTAVVEIVFAWNGLGEWAVNAMLEQDLPSVEAFVFLAGTFTVVIYLLLDTLSALLDPRINFDRRASR
jgi:ABC-type dipeptide/oligopeptide/nickel transport system permease component